MAAEWLHEHIVDVPDYPQPGVVFKDITPLLGNAQAFARAIDELAEPHVGQGITQVVGIDARGFLLAAPVAYRLGAGLTLLRKEGKLPRDVFSAQYALEYGTATLQLHRDALTPNDRAIVVDDVLATGGTAEAAANLVGQSGAELVGLDFLMNLSFLPGAERLRNLGLAVSYLTEY